MNKKTAAALALSCLVTSLQVASQPTASTYRFTLVDAKTGASISPETVQVEVDGEEQILSRDARMASLTAVTPLAQKVKILARPGGEYIPRTVVVSPDGISSKRIKSVAIEKLPARFNLPYLLSGAQRLERGEIDSGLALFEAAAFSGPPRPKLEEVTDYDVLLRWNHARGLTQSCLVLSHATCGEALDRLSVVEADFTNDVNARRYRARSVTHDMVKKALFDLSAKDTKDQYENGLRAFRDKQHDTAIAIWEELLKKPELLNAVKLTRERLESDISFARTRKAEVSESITQ